MRTTNKKPWISVIVPTYNGERYLKECLESVLSQDLGVELIVVDDGSQDATVPIAKKVAKGAQAKIIGLPRQNSWIKMTNEGVRNASADFVCFLHQDDRWVRESAKLRYKLLADHPNIDWFFSPALYISTTGRRLNKWNCPSFMKSGPQPSFNFISQLIVQNFICASSPIIRKSLFENLGLMNETLGYYADWDLWLRLAMQSAPFFEPVPLIEFRVHRNSQSFLGMGDSLNRYKSAHTIISAVTNQDFPLDQDVLKAARINNYINSSLMSLLSCRFDFFTEVRPPLDLLNRKSIHTFFKNSSLSDRVQARMSLFGNSRSAGNC